MSNMRLPGFRLPILSLVAVVTLFAAACSTIDRPIEDGIGTVVVFFSEPSLTVQQLGTDVVSAAEWNVIRSEIIVDGVPYDMGLTVPGSTGVDPVDCVWADTSINPFPLYANAPCGSGRVFPAVLEAGSIRLELEVELTAYRMEPLILDPMGDEDGDMVLNEDDNCPLIENPLQVDLEDNGVGDLCELAAFSPPLADDDGDNFPNVSDRCPWVSAATSTATSTAVVTDILMTDTGTSNTEDPPNTDRTCVSQKVQISGTAGSGTVLIERDIEDFFRVSTLDTTNLVVDFDLENTLASCDWSSGACVVPPSSVKTCIQRGLFGALSGCPN